MIPFLDSRATFYYSSVSEWECVSVKYKLLTEQFLSTVIVYRSYKNKNKFVFEGY